MSSIKKVIDKKALENSLKNDDTLLQLINSCDNNVSLDEFEKFVDEHDEQ